MSRFYQKLDAPRFDYALHRLPGLPDLHFRGPPPADDTRPPIVCLGAAQTFGRFVDRPFSQLLASALDRPVLNLAVGGVGPRHYLHPAWRPHLERAALVIVQLLSGTNASNSHFDDRHEVLHRRGAMRGRRRADGRRTTNHQILEAAAATGGPDLLRQLVAETRADYRHSTAALLDAIAAPKVLLWFSVRRPGYRERWHDLPRLLSAHPHLIDAPTVRALRRHADAYVPVVSRRGLPERLFPSDTEVAGAVRHDGVLFNHHYPSSAMHALAAHRLAPVCRRLLARSGR